MVRGNLRLSTCAGQVDDDQTFLTGKIFHATRSNEAPEIMAEIIQSAHTSEDRHSMAHLTRFTFHLPPAREAAMDRGGSWSLQPPTRKVSPYAISSDK